MKFDDNGRYISAYKASIKSNFRMLTVLSWLTLPTLFILLVFFCGKLPSAPLQFDITIRCLRDYTLKPSTRATRRESFTLRRQQSLPPSPFRHLSISTNSINKWTTHVEHTRIKLTEHSGQFSPCHQASCRLEVNAFSNSRYPPRCLWLCGGLQR